MRRTDQVQRGELRRAEPFNTLLEMLFFAGNCLTRDEKGCIFQYSIRDAQILAHGVQALLPDAAFNTLLEMQHRHRHGDRGEEQLFQYSIRDAPASQTCVSTASGIAFQYSIRDAFAELTALSTSLTYSTLSILY